LFGGGENFAENLESGEEKCLFSYQGRGGGDRIQEGKMAPSATRQKNRTPRRYRSWERGGKKRRDQGSRERRGAILYSNEKKKRFRLSEKESPPNRSFLKKFLLPREGKKKGKAEEGLLWLGEGKDAIQ